MQALPDHREIYLIIGGVIIGILLSPAVLGRISPATHGRWFPAIEKAQQRVTAERLNAKAAKTLTELGGAEAFAAISKKQLTVSDEALDQLKRARAHRGRLIALILTLMAVMIVEVIAQSAGPLTRLRLARARYVLAAVFAALLLAQPAVLLGLSPMFLLLLLGVTLLAAWTPTLRSQTPDP